MDEGVSECDGAESESQVGLTKKEKKIERTEAVRGSHSQLRAGGMYEYPHIFTVPSHDAEAK